MRNTNRHRVAPHSIAVKGREASPTRPYALESSRMRGPELHVRRSSHALVYVPVGSAARRRGPRLAYPKCLLSAPDICYCQVISDGRTTISSKRGALRRNMIACTRNQLALQNRPMIPMLVLVVAPLLLCKACARAKNPKTQRKLDSHRIDVMTLDGSHR